MNDDQFQSILTDDIAASELDVAFETITDERLALELPDAATKSSTVLRSITPEAAAETATAPLAMLQPIPNVRALPWRLIAYLVIEGPDGHLYSGSAFIVGANRLITAGHNLFFHDPPVAGPARRIMVVLGRSGATAIAQVPAVAYRASRAWETEGDYTADYGMIRVDADLTRFNAFTPADFPGGRPIIQIAGYPKADPGGQQWVGQAPVDQVSVRRIGYPVATLSGQSGGPVFLPGTGTAIGVHVRFESFAIGIRLTPSVVDELNHLA